MYIGCYLNLVGGRILRYYYHYYTWILRIYFGLNMDAVFNQIINATPTNLYNKPITVKLAVSNGKITIKSIN